MERTVTRRWIGASVAAGLVVLFLSGCAAEANRTGEIASFSPISDLITGFLQGLFILIAVIVLIVLGSLGGFSTDLFQADRGIWYQIGFLLGLLVMLYGPFGIVRIRRTRRSTR